MNRLLEGVRILDLSRVLAGPWATQLMADMGATVIKVERPHEGDDTRKWGPPWLQRNDVQTSAYYLCANRGKLALAADFASSEGQELIRTLAAGSDVVVDISVYDHPTPLAELERLVALNDLYFTDSDPADMVEVTPQIARELQEIWIERDFYDGPADGEVDAEFQSILTDYMGWENYDLRIDEVADVDVEAGETLRIDREVLEDIRAVFREGRYR